MESEKLAVNKVQKPAPESAKRKISMVEEEAQSHKIEGGSEAIGGSPVKTVEKNRAAQSLLNHGRRQGLDALNEIFRMGTPPDPPLDGRYAGTLVALDLAPGLTQLSQSIAAAWMPWQGKWFDAAGKRGDNIFGRDSLPVSHLFWPFYRSYLEDGPATYRAFPFRTYVAPGRADRDRSVLKIDYDITGNPRLTIRRVLDELVQVTDGLYLGKALLKWWWARDAWQVVAYFSLENQGAGN